MGGVILLFIVAVLVTILIQPALRARGRRNDPPSPPANDTRTHEVVVPQLDDFSKKKPGDDAKGC